MDATTGVALAVVIVPLLWGFTFVLIKREVTRVLAKVEKIPDDAFFPNINWYNNVNEAIRRIPSEDFMRSVNLHIDKSGIAESKIDRHSFELEALWKKVDNDHNRIGKNEADIAFNTQRIGFLEERMKSL